jgi:hypothetical protein
MGGGPAPSSHGRDLLGLAPRARIFPPPPPPLSTSPSVYLPLGARSIPEKRAYPPIPVSNSISRVLALRCLLSPYPGWDPSVRALAAFIQRERGGLRRAYTRMDTILVYPGRGAPIFAKRI